MRNVATLVLFAAVAVLVHLSLFSRRVGGRTRRELCMAMAWLVVPFLPGASPPGLRRAHGTQRRGC